MNLKGTNAILQKYVKTNMGIIPLEDYYEIVAQQNGFRSYEELQNEGLSVTIDESAIIIKEK